MNAEQTVFIYLTQIALGANSLAPETLPSPDWGEVFRLACINHMEGVLFRAAAGLPDERRPPAELLDAWKKRVIPQLVTQLTANAETYRLVCRMEADGIPCVLFKGLVLGELYPQAEMRFSGDADILVRPQDRQAARDVFVTMGYQCLDDTSKENVHTWVLPGKLIVEMHFRLWEDYKDERVMRLDQMELTSPGTLVQAPLSCGPVWTMGYTEHLIYQMFHIVKHISFLGINLRNLTDAALFVNRYLKEIDFRRFWSSMEEVRYARFCDAMFKTFSAYWGVSRRAWCPSRMDDPYDPEHFLTDVLNHCINDSARAASGAASASIYHIFNEAAIRSHPVTRFHLVRCMLFPGWSSLSHRYEYARRHHFLLPVAWVHRALRSLFTPTGKPAEDISLSTTLNMAKQKLEMMRKLELME